MTNNEIVAKLWNLCNVLRDDGITYHQYVTELTYILFLKMADETGADKGPAAVAFSRILERPFVYDSLEERTLGSDEAIHVGLPGGE